MSNQVTTVKNYRAKFGAREVQLPSSMSFVLRRVSLPSLIGMGVIPQDLTTAALESKSDDESQDEMTGEGSAERAINGMRLMRYVIAAACVSPQVVVEQAASDETLTVEELDPMDQAFIFAFAMRREFGASVPLTSGEEVKVDSLKNFHPRGRRRNAPAARKNQ